jgi:hypothetical protein
MKTTIALIALVAIGLLLIWTLPKSPAFFSLVPVAPVSAAMPLVASTIAHRETGPGKEGEVARPAAHFTAQTPDPSDEETLQLVRDIYEALGSDDAARHDLVFAEFVPSLILLDPAAAGYLAEIWEPGPVRAELLRRVGQEWSKRDPAAAVAWAASLQDFGERMRALSDECMQISQSNPAEATAIADHFDLGNSNDGTLENVAQLWAGKDLLAVLDWARGRAPGEQRDRLMARIAFVNAETMPADAARLVSEEMAPGQVQDEAFMSVLHQWGLRDQAAAAAWAGSVTRSALRERAISELAGIARN